MLSNGALGSTMQHFPKCIYWILLVVVALSVLSDRPVLANQNSKIAILEFQNDAGTIIQKNRWTMAEDLGKYLKKKDKRLQAMKKKEVIKALHELSWEGDRLEPAQEAKLLESGAQYAVYGKVVMWRVKPFLQVQSGFHSSVTTVQYSLELVDLESGKVIRTLIVDGTATATIGKDEEWHEDPMDTDESKYEDRFEEASETALQKAARDITGLLITE